MNFLICLLHADIQRGCWNNLHKQHLQWSNGDEKEHFSSTFCLLTLPVKAITVFQWKTGCGLQAGFKLLQSNSRIGSQDWTVSPPTGIWWWWIFHRAKERTGLSYTLLQRRGLHCQRDCSMPFSPTFQEQDGYWVRKIQSLFLPE